MTAADPLYHPVEYDRSKQSMPIMMDDIEGTLEQQQLEIELYAESTTKQEYKEEDESVHSPIFRLNSSVQYKVEILPEV